MFWVCLLFIIVLRKNLNNCQNATFNRQGQADKELQENENAKHENIKITRC